METGNPYTPRLAGAEIILDRDTAIKAIRKALKSRSGKAWSVKHDTGTASGWIDINVPPSRRTWHNVDTGQKDDRWNSIYREVNDPSMGEGHIGPDDRAELAKLLGLTSVDKSGVSIPHGSDYYREYVDRAEGREPSTIGQRYWD